MTLWTDASHIQLLSYFPPALLGCSLVFMVQGFYSASDDVVELNPSNFNQEVLQSDSLWLIEFYAPWWVVESSLGPMRYWQLAREWNCHQAVVSVVWNLLIPITCQGGTPNTVCRPGAHSGGCNITKCLDRNVWCRMDYVVCQAE